MAKEIPEIRSFTHEGEEEFKNLITSSPSDLKTRLLELIFDSSLTRGEFGLRTPWSMPVTRGDVGEALYPYLGPAGPLKAFAADKKLWNWVSAAYLAHHPNPLSLVGNIDLWIYNDRSNRYYRHNFFSSFFVYESHVDSLSDVEALLYRDIDEPKGEFLEQVLATSDVAHSVGARLANRLYFDAVRREIRPGASSKGPGTVRRLTAAYLNQIKLNVDFKSMSVEDLVKVLPSEFDRFKVPPAAGPTISKSNSDQDDEPNFNEFKDQANF
jgi:hypothetical protein